MALRRTEGRVSRKQMHVHLKFSLGLTQTRKLANIKINGVYFTFLSISESVCIIA